MRMDPSLDPHLAGQPWQQRANVGRFQRLALEGAEEWLAACRPQALACVHPPGDHPHRSGIHPDGSAAIILPVQHGDTAGQTSSQRSRYQDPVQSVPEANPGRVDW